MSGQIYVDESKRNGYFMVGTVIESGRAREARHALEALLLPGQERLHFKSESDQRRRVILPIAMQYVSIAFGATVVKPTTTRLARSQCLSYLVRVALKSGVERIVIEREDSLLGQDKTVVFSTLRQELGKSSALVTYSWEPARQEPLLWIADAFAWAYTKGGSWAAVVAPRLTAVVIDI